MTFVDTNVFIYAVGGEHPLRASARAFLDASLRRRTALCTSAEVLQELMHAYLPVGRMEQLDAAFSLIADTGVEVWPLEAGDVHLARRLGERFPELAARDLCFLASCRRRSVAEIGTFDRALASAAGQAALG